MLLRLLLIFLICYVVFFALKSFIARKSGRRDDSSQPGEPMVLDPQCQAYIPKSTALARGGEYFCSEECARRFLAR